MCFPNRIKFLACFLLYNTRVFLVPNTRLELIEEFFAEYIVSRSEPSVRDAIAATVKKFPMATAACVAFAFVSIASSLESPIVKGKENNEKLSAELYRAIAVFVADIYAVEELYGAPAICAHIFDFWMESEDTFFYKEKF